jgi:hypothetical protein
MKTIEFSKITGNTIEFVCGDETPRIPMQQVTIPHFSPNNRGWMRQIQISNEFLMIKRPGCPTVGIHVDDIINLAIAAESKLSWPPVFIGQPAKNSLGELTVSVSSELTDVSYQWQSSEDGKEWKDIDGQRGTGFSDTGFKFVRCVATNGAGSTFSNVCQFQS